MSDWVKRSTFNQLLKKLYMRETETTIYIPVALYSRDQTHSDPIYDLRQALQLAAEHVIPCFPDHLHPTMLQRIVPVDIM